jgi:hypothetical protein
MLSCCAGQLLRAMVDVTIFCPNLAQFLRVGLVQNLRAVPLLALNSYRTVPPMHMVCMDEYNVAPAPPIFSLSPIPKMANGRKSVRATFFFSLQGQRNFYFYDMTTTLVKAASSLACWRAVVFCKRKKGVIFIPCERILCSCFSLASRVSKTGLLFVGDSACPFFLKASAVIL